MNKRMLILILCISICCTLTACWDLRDIGHVALVTAIGIDLLPEDPEQYLVSFEIANPGKLKEQGSTPSAIIKTAAGRSMGEALERVQAQVSRKVNLSHLRILILGEQLVRERSFEDISNFFIRFPHVSMRLRFLVVDKGMAREIFQLKPDFDKLLSTELVEILQLNTEYSLAHIEKLYNFISELKVKNGRAIGTRLIKGDDNNTLYLAGSSIFNNGRLVGWLNEDETQGANFLLPNTLDSTVVAEAGSSNYTYQLKKKKVSIMPKYEKGILAFDVKVETMGRFVEEKGKNIKLDKQEDIKKLEELFAQVISERIEKVIYISQKKLNVDFLGFGEKLRKYDYKTFSETNWQDDFRTVPINVQVKVDIERFGLAP